MTAAAAAPADSAANDFGRNAARNGPAPVKVVLTSVLPPKIGVTTVTPSPESVMSMLLVMTVLSSFTDKRDMMSRPSVFCGNMMRSGVLPPSMTLFNADAIATPGRFFPISTARTAVAPYSPRAAASAPLPAMNAVTLEESERALVSNSSVADVGAPLAACAKTQMLFSAIV